jgi:regulator of sigma E protease
LIIIHELGHAIVARRNGVVVEEFGIGLPPRAKKLGVVRGVPVTLNWLPIGGFCQLRGESDAATINGSYGAASYWSKTKILLAGVTVNLVFAAVIFTGMSLFGMPKLLPNQFYLEADANITTSAVVVAAVGDNSPAAAAGLGVGDELVSIAGEAIDESSTVTTLTAANRGQTVDIVYRHDGAEVTSQTTLREVSDGGYLGVSVGQNEFVRSTWSAPIVGVVNTAQFAWMTVQSLGDLVMNLAGGIAGSLSGDEQVRQTAGADLSRVGDSVSGPVGIIGVIFPTAVSAGPSQIFLLVGIVSLTLAVMNLLPIPGLDGGRWLLTTVFKIIRRPLTEKLEGTINGIGMMLLMGLFVVITVVDIFKL